MANVWQVIKTKVGNNYLTEVSMGNLFYRSQE